MPKFNPGFASSIFVQYGQCLGLLKGIDAQERHSHGLLGSPVQPLVCVIGSPDVVRSDAVELILVAYLELVGNFGPVRQSYQPRNVIFFQGFVEIVKIRRFD